VLDGPYNEWCDELVEDLGKNVKVLLCPTDAARPGANTNYLLKPLQTPDPAIDAINMSPRSYIMNAWNEAYGQAVSTNRAINELTIPHPSDTIVLGEKKNTVVDFWMDSLVGDIVNDLSHGLHGAGQPSKSGGHNDAFVDGSARYYKFGADVAPVGLWWIYDVNRTLPANTTALLTMITP